MIKPFNLLFSSDAATRVRCHLKGTSGKVQLQLGGFEPKILEGAHPQAPGLDHRLRSNRRYNGLELQQ